MAKIKMGALMTDIRGSAGGSVFARNGGGAYMRNKSTPLNPQTADQSGIRSIFGQISQAWSGLTESQRAGFNTAVNNYAQTDVFGDEQTLSGKALFQKLNLNLLLAGQETIVEVPVSQNVPALDDLSIEYNTTSGALSLTLNGAIAGGFTFVYATPKLTQGTSFVKNRLRLIKVISGEITSEDITQSYENKFGTVTDGDRIAIAVRGVASNGQNGPRSTSFVVYSA